MLYQNKQNSSHGVLIEETWQFMFRNWSCSTSENYDPTCSCATRCCWQGYADILWNCPTHHRHIDCNTACIFTHRVGCLVEPNGNWHWGERMAHHRNHKVAPKVRIHWTGIITLRWNSGSRFDWSISSVEWTEQEGKSSLPSAICTQDANTITEEMVILLRKVRNSLLLAMFPGLPHFYFPFSFTVIHGSGRAMKTGKAWENLWRQVDTRRV